MYDMYVELYNHTGDVSVLCTVPLTCKRLISKFYICGISTVRCQFKIQEDHVNGNLISFCVMFLCTGFQNFLVILFVPYNIYQTIVIFSYPECKQENNFDHAFLIWQT